jgi:hypothetical protein
LILTPENAIARISSPRSVVTTRSVNLFVSSEASDQVLEYDGATGQPVGNGVLVSQGSAGLHQPSFLVFGPTPVPEPSSLTLLGLGSFGLLGYGWRRQKRIAA